MHLFDIVTGKYIADARDQIVRHLKNNSSLARLLECISSAWLLNWIHLGYLLSSVSNCDPKAEGTRASFVVR